MATLKSEAYPPYDPWFAGGFMNYYYFGQVIIATLIKLSGIEPSMAFNLAVPTLFALALAGAFSAGYNLARSPGGSRARAYLGGGFAALFAVCIGNLATIGQVLDQLWRNAGVVDVRSTLPFVEGAARTLAGLYATVFLGRGFPLPTDWYWASSRVYTGAAVVNEFPLFTFLFADLHAHMIALPFTLLALGVAINALRSTRRRDSSHAAPPTLLGQIRSGALFRNPGYLLVASLAIGALAPINSWDFPTYLGVFGLALMIAAWYATQRSSRDGRVQQSARFGIGWYAAGAAALQWLVVAILAYVLYLPFYRWYQSFYTGVDPAPERSEPIRYLAIHGLFLFILLSYLVYIIWRDSATSGLAKQIRQVIRHRRQWRRVVTLQNRLMRKKPAGWRELAYAGIVAVALLALLWVTGFQALAMLLVLMAPALVILLRPDGSRRQKMVLGLLCLGLALGAFCELFAIKGDIGRMNTVFKFYLQVWILWAVAAGAVLPRIWERLSCWQWKTPRGTWQWALAVLISVSLIYPLLGVRTRIQDRFDNTIGMTLDGTAYAARAIYSDQNRPISLADDMAAIRWMLQNVEGSPVILEAATPTYRWGARFSIYTGLPTVLGWDWHQKQQRWGYQWMVDQRANDVRAIYSEAAPERILSLLEKYRVRYIIAGDLERAYYPAVGLDKFDRMVGKQLDLVYSQGSVKIYAMREGG
jgi:YYY domain-containing protein